MNKSITKQTPQSKTKRAPIEKTTYNALELYKNRVVEIPKLLDPFLQTVGLASLVGTSDGGKSTFLRQLGISIVLELEDFLSFKLESKHNKVIYVSTEDDPISISYAIKKQIEYLKKKNLVTDESKLANLQFIFDSNNLLNKLKALLTKDSVDLIIIDAFTDVFTKEINANTQVRNFLNDFDRLAKKHSCLILFLHHIGKRTTKFEPSKDSIIGSQGFEAKMRVVLELRPRNNEANEIDLWVLKSNFLEAQHKKNSYVLNFNKDLVFEDFEIRGNKKTSAKLNDTELIKKVLEHHKKGMSYREIEKALKNTEYEVSKSSIGKIIIDNKPKE